MTSTFARNYNYAQLDPEHYLQTNKEGQPLQGQVPQTYQRYSGTGAESIEIDGSNRLVIDSDLADGPLLINANANYNWYGRVVHILLLQTLASPLTFSYLNGEIHTAGTEATANVLVFPAGQTPTHLIADFYSLADVFVSETNSAVDPVPPVLSTTTLNLEMFHSAAWTLDNAAAGLIQWDPASPNSFNSTSVTYSALTDLFSVVNTSDYFVSVSLSLRGFLDRCLRISLVGPGLPNGSVVLGETSVGLSCQNLTGTWSGRLAAGTTLGVQSQLSPLLPLPGAQGLMNGLNTQLGITGSNFIQIIQMPSQ